MVGCVGPFRGCRPCSRSHEDNAESDEREVTTHFPVVSYMVFLHPTCPKEDEFRRVSFRQDPVLDCTQFILELEGV